MGCCSSCECNLRDFMWANRHIHSCSHEHVRFSLQHLKMKVIRVIESDTILTFSQFNSSKIEQSSANHISCNPRKWEIGVLEKPKVMEKIWVFLNFKMTKRLFHIHVSVFLAKLIIWSFWNKNFLRLKKPRHFLFVSKLIPMNDIQGVMFLASSLSKYA